MYLITMAHLGEALALIEHFKLKKIQPNLFKNEKILLLITGEGPFEGAVRTSLILSCYEIKKVMNLGIAGSLREDLSTESLVPVRSFYLLSDFKPFYKSFPTQLEAHEGEGLDCLTSFERILDPSKAKMLRGLGAMVDREGWGVAFACKEKNVPFSSFKIISDIAGTPGACELVKERAQDFSEKLCSHVVGLLQAPAQDLPPQEELSGFYFTHSTHHQFKRLLQKLMIKTQKKREEVLEELNLAELRSLGLRPKEKTKLLLELMEERIDPTKKIIQTKISHLIQSFKEKGVNLQVDPLLENPQASISFLASSDEELHQKISELKTLSLLPLTEIMHGKFHVE